MGKSGTFSPGSESPEICIIGAGFAGLCAAVQLKRKLNYNNFTVYESNKDVGGCWLANTYPGAACSVPSHVYSYSFAKNWDWSSLFAGQAEIVEYMKEVGRKNDIYKHMKFGCEVRKLIWKEELRKWKVHVFNKETNIMGEIYYDIIVLGTGLLRCPNKPKEFKEFQGPVIHTAEWDHNINLEGKTVAVIGSGQSAVQVIPGIVNKVSKLISYQREPIWMVPLGQLHYGKLSQMAFAHSPGLRRGFRSAVLVLSVLFEFSFHRRIMLSLANRLARLLHNSQFKNDPELREALRPNHQFFCKIPGFGTAFHSALKLSHAKVVRSRITGVTPNTIITEDGKEENVDIIILATGFRVQDYFAPMEIIGSNSENILSKWEQNGPSGYLGITSCDMPNLFIIAGPRTVPIGSLIFQIECQVHFIIKMLKEMRKRSAKKVTVTESSELDYMEGIDKDLEKSILGSEYCENVNSWYLKILYTSGFLHYWKRARSVDASKFDFD